jgi:signal transduction histidine kinase
MSPTLTVALIALITSGLVAAAGTVLARVGAGRSMRGALVAVAAVSVLSVVAGVVGTAQAMFLSRHDFGVVLTVSAVAGVVGLAVALALAGRVMSDVGLLLDAAAAVGPDGIADPDRLPAPRMAELRRVRDELAATGARLAEGRRREQSLEASRRELVAWVSHDLRTPLAGLRAMAEALEDDVADDPARYHRQIRREVDRLSRMVDDLFELSRIQSGALTLSLEQVEVEALVNDVISGAQAVAAARGVRLDTRLAPATVEADAAGLGRVLANLVVNAIRHTPSDGTVQVSVQVSERSGQAGDDGEAGDDVVLSVSDRCGGIGEAELERVFDAGWRGTDARTPDADPAGSGSSSGAGLGLAIARGIVEAHHGRIGVQNTPGGCTFEVTLPSTLLPVDKA